MNKNPFDNMAGDGRFKDRLRNRIGESVARNQQEGEQLREQLTRFLHARGRLWLGLPAVAVITFLSLFLLRTLDLPVTEALAKGGIAAGIVSLWWVVGIWGSADRRLAKEKVEEDDENPLSRWIERQKQRSVIANRLLRGFGVLLSVAALVAICSPQLEMLFTEDGQTVHAVFGILLKLLCAGALALPVKLTAPRE